MKRASVSQANRLHPTVLVYGDYARDGVEPFSRNAWEAIRGHLSEDHKFLDKVWEKVATDSRIQPALQEILEILKKVGRQRLPVPLPLPFLDDGHQPTWWLREHLFRYLACFDVWAVLAVGRTACTQRLLTALHPLQIPVLVTLSSVAQVAEVSQEVGVAHGAHILTLFPSNETQAQVIAAHVHHLLPAGGGLRQVYILKETAGDPYVADLSRALESHFQLQHVLARDVRTSHEVRAGAVVVSIGYDTVLDEIRELPREYKHILLTDGLDPEIARERWATNATRGQPSRYYYGVRPILAPETHAGQGYCAVRAVRQEEFFTPRVEREVRLEPFVDRVRRRLERDYDYYEFAGSRNIRASYLVERIGLEGKA